MIFLSLQAPRMACQSSLYLYRSRHTYILPFKRQQQSYCSQRRCIGLAQRFPSCRSHSTTRTTSDGSKSNSSGNNAMSRKERRRLEREMKASKHKSNGSAPAVQTIATKTTTNSSSAALNSLHSIRSSFQKWIPNPRIPGGRRTLFHSAHRKHLCIRLGLAVFLILLFEAGEISPYSIDMAQGPSMLPTIATIGDIYLRETGSWSRFFGIPIQYHAGDIVVFRDETGRYAGKRIIGVEGDEVLRYGQFVKHYLNRPDWGICEPLNKHKQFLSEDEEHNNNTNKDRDFRQRIKIPPNHVWLEGDFPPFSVDSRHYGPIPVEWIRGRILCRVWPWRHDSLSNVRPIPISVDEALSHKHNLHVNPALAANANASTKE